ncbi:hypothetical protein NLU13_5881 [Sarocladium strictum]|uniref:Major facilitator superfamily transporter n=1 Tax=Sarocladium strictum TaxID=5046 RepID=A0AA39L6W9_SARSR|nr:hypothetical protein NLU13_5881 [Sarocladium strictum]
MAPGNETTPLLAERRKSIDSNQDERPKSLFSRLFGVENRILLAGFLITLSFSYTQVPLFYVFHLMECDNYYDSHPPYEGPGDRCSVDAVTAATATQFSILGMSTTLCGTLNLFLTGMLVKRFGPRTALLQQTIVPALRVLAQIVGVMAGKRTGINIIQCTQLITIIGGPVGYILVVNIIAGEVVEPSKRTAVFGKLQGAIMMGQGIGFLAGGMIGDAIEIRAPFDVAFVSFMIAAVYVRTCLPYISPESMSDGTKPAGSSISGFLAPLKILAPQRLRTADGRSKKHYGVIFLCCGIFLAVLATGYVPLLIQMYATAAFEFSQGDNGWLMAEFAFVRGLFLMLLFPRIISWGRKRMSSKNTKSSGSDQESGLDVQAIGAASSGATTPYNTAGGSDLNSRGTTIVEIEAEDEDEASKLLPTDPGQFDMPEAGEQVDQEPIQPAKPKHTAEEDESPAFDLVFLRWSLVIDGLMTTIAAFATERWHIYLAAFLLPFGSGSAPAAKGVITQMCSDSQRADALNAVTLVENIARLSTQGFFGFIFASLADVGKAYATFFCNAAVAMVGVGVLMLSHFPPDGAEVVDVQDEDEPVEAPQAE